MGFHRDNSENDGAGDFPVVSLTIGNSSIFSLKHERDMPAIDLVLLSGDAVLFGGPCRQMLHAVTEVHQGTAPDWLPEPFRNSRLNFTFRHAPEILGDEKRFQYFKPGVKPCECIEACEPSRLSPSAGRPRTKDQVVTQFGNGWEETRDSSPAGPAAAAKESEGSDPCRHEGQVGNELAALTNASASTVRRWKTKGN
jgi:hypothetical protein